MNLKSELTGNIIHIFVFPCLFESFPDFPAWLALQMPMQCCSIRCCSIQCCSLISVSDWPSSSNHRNTVEFSSNCWIAAFLSPNDSVHWGPLRCPKWGTNMCKPWKISYCPKTCIAHNFFWIHTQVPKTMYMWSPLHVLSICHNLLFQF